MVRILAILMLLVAGAPGLGVLSPGDRGAGSCEDMACHRLVVRTTCCGERIETSVCDMDSGNCTCGIAPVPERQPEPTAPPTRTERNAPSTLSPEPPVPLAVVAWAQGSPKAPAGAQSLLAALTNNEIQAFMGIWRT